MKFSKVWKMQILSYKIRILVLIKSKSSYRFGFFNFTYISTSSPLQIITLYSSVQFWISLWFDKTYNW